ncbi:nitrate- and nitrite sensing domain-containing protein [Streptomyces sp. B6B3]|uniref:sensor histidine kinase n=1 Tax=Streptomyces sp. B6B3 TaxID=3153570 RepID=UPI00325D0B3E
MQGRFKREGSAAEGAELSGTQDRGSSGGPALGGDRTWPSADGEESGRDRADEHHPAPGSESDRDEKPAPRSGSPGSRLLLRNWRISTRLVSLILLPVVAATFFGVLRIQNSMDDIEQLDNLQIVTDLTEQATRLASTLQDERDRSAGPLVSGGNEKSDEVVAPRDATDAQLSAFESATAAIDPTDDQMRGVNGTVLYILQQLDELDQIREEAYADPDYVSQTVFRYNLLIDSLLGLSQDMAEATSNSDMIRSTRALATFSSAKESASVQRAIITAALARAELPGGEATLSSADWRYGDTHRSIEESALTGFKFVYPDAGRADELLNPLDSGGVSTIVQANQYRDRVFASPEGIHNAEQRTYMDWNSEARTKIDQMDTIEQTLILEMRRQAQQLRDDAQRDALINAVVTALVLAISLVGAFWVARSMVRSLRRLQNTAQDVARRRLPEVVKQMSEADPQDVDTTVEPVGVYTRDEIGRVAQAFDDVHQEAVRLAGEQALLRGNVNAMFTNLSRRSQGLIQRQLSLISELESREADPDQLSSLFKLDHLATRMRRNGENLLVLAGEEPGRRWTRPVPLVDVLRAAASEVEQYERIELSAVPKTDVAGRVVNDLVHLLAELLENATSFSSPQTKVKVTGHSLPDRRILVEIHDTGIGLSPEDLAEINDRLANPPTVDVSVSRRMGLFVVGRLSLRHGIRIQLRPSDSGGTTALVMLPADVAQGVANRGRPPGGGTPGGTPTATLQRETPPAGGPAAGDVTSGNTVRLSGRGRGLAGLSKAGPLRGQVPGGPERPALPSRSGQGGPPAAPSGPATPAGQEPRPTPPRRTPAPRADQPARAEQPAPPELPQRQPNEPAAAGSRPSWASTEDSGQIPVVPTREQPDRPRGHDETEPLPPVRSGRETGEFPRPSFPSTPRPAAATPAAGPQDTGEHPLAQPTERPAAPAQRPDELTDPLPAPAPERMPERTPIFEEMESTWFGTRRAVAPSPAAPAKPAAAAAPPPARSAEHTGPVPTPRADQPASAVPPAAERQAARAEPGPGAPWRPSPNDESWRQAEQLRQPSAGGVTTSGLPRRVPRANLVAGAAEPQQQAAPTGPLVSRAPADVRGRLTNLRRGIQQGRQAGSSAGQSDRDYGPTYQ